MVQKCQKTSFRARDLRFVQEVGFFESALAGVATGLWNIPKGFFSLGAEIYDLVGDTNTAKSVEQWFDDVNPFDDEAEAKSAESLFSHRYSTFIANPVTHMLK